MKPHQHLSPAFAKRPWYTWVRKAAWSGLAILLLGSVQAQVLLNEQFTGGVSSTGFTTTQTAGTCNWSFNNPGARSITGAGFDAGFAIFDSDQCGVGDGNVSTGNLISPPFDASAYPGANYRLSFDISYRHCCNSIATVDAWNGTSWINMWSTPAADFGYPDPALHVSFAIPAGGNPAAQVRIQYSGNFAYWLAVDNITVERIYCLAPTNFTVSNLTVNSAFLSWDASASLPMNGYEWEVRSSGLPGHPGATALGNTGSGVTSIAVGGLTSNTTYWLWIRSRCGNGIFGDWTPAIGFTTPCDVLALPFTENFETAILPPACWTESNADNLLFPESGPPGSGASGPNGSAGDTASFGFNFYSLQSGTAASLTSAHFNPAPAGYQVRFDVAGAGYSTLIDSVYLEASGDGGTSWTVLQAMSNEPGAGVLNTASSSGTAFFPAAADWTTLAYALPTGTDLVRFRGVSGFGNNVFFDNVAIEAGPTCLPPTIVAINNVTATGADLVWGTSPSNPANGYQWEVRSSGSPGDPGPDASGTTPSGVTTASASGLAANTAYTLYVRSDCGGGDHSTWAYMGFTTACAATNIPYMENFDAVITPAIPACMTTQTIGGSTWTSADGTSNGFTGNAARYRWDVVQAADSWLFTQGLNLTAGTSYRLSYRYGAAASAWTESMNVAYGSSPAATGMTNPMADHASINTAPLTNAVDFTPASSGVYYIGFHAYSAPDQYMLLLDDISVALSTSCTGDRVVVLLNTDAAPEQTNWEIRDESNTVVASGAPVIPEGLNTDTACLGVTTGHCYSFSLHDSFGDGLNGMGNWELHTAEGAMILRDLFANGNTSPGSPTASPGYGAGHSLCLPLGPANIAASECGIFTNAMGNKVYADPVVGAAHYQFEFTDPDAGFIRRIAAPRRYVHFSDMVTYPLVPGVKYFVRVRTDVAGPIASSHFGAGCEVGMSIPATVPCSHLIEAPAYGHSCNETRAFNPSTNNSFIYAVPVQGASQYQFRIFNATEGYDEMFTRSTYILQLKWNNTVAPPLVNGSTYQVQVNVQVGGLYSGFCGNSCTITIDNGAEALNNIVQVYSGVATIWPNPVRDGQVNLSITGLSAGSPSDDPTGTDQHITVEVHDMYGNQVFAKEYGNSGEQFNTILQLRGDIASGVYLVNITVNGERTVRQLSIIK